MTVSKFQSEDERIKDGLTWYAAQYERLNKIKKKMATNGVKIRPNTYLLVEK
jgi:hypothetical protein